jgi:RND family efflux transporter MFP subunit
MKTGFGRTALIFGLSVAALAVLAMGGFLLHAKRVEALQQVPPPEQFPWALRTVPVVKQDLTAGFPVLATLQAQTEVSITPQISGVIREMGPREGQPVKKGSLLVQLDTRELENQLAALKASRQGAEDEVTLRYTELKRQEALFERGFAPQEKVDALRTAWQTATQRVSQLRGEIEALTTRLNYGTMLAPMDGVISARLQEPGDLATPGHPIYRITGTDGARIRIIVPQTVAARLHKGSEVLIEQGEQSILVTVSRVFPSLDALSMGSAEADLEKIPFGLPSGARVPGRVILDRWPEALIVPRTALVLAPDGTRATIFRVVGDSPAQIESVSVKIIASGREGVAISGAISEGDRVAVAQENELLKLKDGDAVLPEPERGQ